MSLESSLNMWDETTDKTVAFERQTDSRKGKNRCIIWKSDGDGFLVDFNRIIFTDFLEKIVTIMFDLLQHLSIKIKTKCLRLSETIPVPPRQHTGANINYWDHKNCTKQSLNWVFIHCTFWIWSHVTSSCSPFF